MKTDIIIFTLRIRSNVIIIFDHVAIVNSYNINVAVRNETSLLLTAFECAIVSEYV